MQEFACFDDNDEMIIKKLTPQQAENPPKGFVRVKNGTTGPQYKVDGTLTGEAAISNLENICK